MSYCRWSSDDFGCDVYCYRDMSGGFTTHVAGRRVVGEVPKLTGLTGPIDGFVKSYRKQMKFMETAEHVDIGLPHDGESFNDDDISGLHARLLSLKAIGYHVPQHAIDAVRAEMEDEERLEL